MQKTDALCGIRSFPTTYTGSQVLMQLWVYMDRSGAPFCNGDTNFDSLHLMRSFYIDINYETTSWESFFLLPAMSLFLIEGQFFTEAAVSLCG